MRNQDDEFTDRLRRAGGRVRLLPGRSRYYWSRAASRGLWRQYHGYGFWKVRVIRMRGGWPSSPRHLVPAAFVLALAAGGALGGATGHAAWAAVVPALYSAFLVAATAASLGRDRDTTALWLPVVLPVLHAAYGAGFLAALAVRGGGPAAPAPDSAREAEAA